MPRFSSAYVPHTNKLLTDHHLQAAIGHQIDVVRYFDYFLLEKIPVDIASRHVVGHHEVLHVQRRRLILILRRSVARSRYLILRLHQMGVLLALMLQQLRLKSQFNGNRNLIFSSLQTLALSDLLVIETHSDTRQMILPCWHIACDTTDSHGERS